LRNIVYTDHEELLFEELYGVLSQKNFASFSRAFWWYASKDRLPKVAFPILHENQKDIHLFLGTTRQYHLVAPNPFVVIGTFCPPKPQPLYPEQTTFKADGIQQQKLFD